MLEAMRVVIFGKNGNLGREMIRTFSHQEVIGLGRSECDITDKSQVTEILNHYKPEIVVNCAAYNDVDGAEDNKLLAEQINGLVPGHMAGICSSNGAVFVHFSSGQVFNGENSRGYNEADITSPVNAYGASKLLGENIIQKNTERFYIVRTEWLFGDNGNSSSSKKSFIDIMLELAKKSPSVKAITDEYGKPTYTKDLALATRLMIENHEPFGIYHITNSGTASRYLWAEKIFELNDIPVRLDAVSSSFFKRRAKRPNYEILNNNKLADLRPWEEALKDYLEPPGVLI